MMKLNPKPNKKNAEIVSVVASRPSDIRPTLPLIKPVDNFKIAKKKSMKILFRATALVLSKYLSISLLLFFHCINKIFTLFLTKFS